MGRHITIGTAHTSPRLAYVAHVIFERILAAEVAWTDLDGPADLYYGGTPSPDRLTIPANGQLFETGLPTDFPTDQFTAELPDFRRVDALAWAFFHLVEARAYGEELAPSLPAGEDPALIEDLAFALSDELGWDRPVKAFDYEVTIDVDHPWKHQHKPFAVRWGGMLKALLGGRGAEVQERWRAVMGGQDPYDIDELIREMCPADQTRLFFLVDGQAPQDSHYDLRMPAYAQRVAEFQAAGFSCGLHPSFLTYNQPQLLAEEKKLLESVVGEVIHSRQHYLRYALPGTFRSLLDLGIRYEYSTALNQHPGARTRIMRPYPWFDLERNVQTELEIVPAQVMDRTLQQYLGLSPEAAWPVVRRWIDRVRSVNGKFVVILHNETFSESGEWQGWRSLITQLLAELERDEG